MIFKSLQFIDQAAVSPKRKCKKRERRDRKWSKEENKGITRVFGFNRNENAEPIGACSRVRRKIDNVVRRIPNPLHRFFNPICRSFAARIPTESIACEPFAAIRPTSAKQRIEKLHRERKREREKGK